MWTKFNFEFGIVFTSKKSLNVDEERRDGWNNNWRKYHSNFVRLCSTKVSSALKLLSWNKTNIVRKTHDLTHYRIILFLYGNNSWGICSGNSVTNFKNIRWGVGEWKDESTKIRSILKYLNYKIHENGEEQTNFQMMFLLQFYIPNS